MPVKIIDIEAIGPVHFYKKRGLKNIRLSFTAAGQIRVTLPAWTPYQAAVSFTSSKRDWILKNMPSKPQPLTDGLFIGGGYTMRLVATDEVEGVTTQLLGKTILVEHSFDLAADSEKVQAAATRAALRALRKHAEETLPHRTRALADDHGYKVGDIRVRQLKRRWGSCDHKGNITLNFFLIQLPDKLLDYVLMHELTHTKHMNHQPVFWKEVETVLPDFKLRRKLLKNYKPALSTPDAPMPQQVD